METPREYLSRRIHEVIVEVGGFISDDAVEQIDAIVEMVCDDPRSDVVIQDEP